MVVFPVGIYRVTAELVIGKPVSLMGLGLGSQVYQATNGQSLFVFQGVQGVSVSGLYLSHPQSRYFMLGRIGRDQLEDYALRKGQPIGDGTSLLQRRAISLARPTRAPSAIYPSVAQQRECPPHMREVGGAHPPGGTSIRP